jgi:hypothetical protein
VYERKGYRKKNAPLIGDFQCRENKRRWLLLNFKMTITASTQTILKITLGILKSNIIFKYNTKGNNETTTINKL